MMKRVYIIAFLWTLAIGLIVSHRPSSIALRITDTGRVLYCANCRMTNPCSKGGTGALAFNVEGQWNCMVSGTSPMVVQQGLIRE